MSFGVTIKMCNKGLLKGETAHEGNYQFFELYNLFDTVTFQTVYICRLTDNQICETTDILSFGRNSVLLCVSQVGNTSILVYYRSIDLK